MADITGMDAFNAAIARLTADLQQDLPDIALQGAAIVEQKISERVPQHTGNLLRSLDDEVAQRRSGASATVQMDDSRPGGVEHYAIFVEYGTSKMAADPFFRPGVEEAKPEVQELMQRLILEKIAQHGN